MKSGRRGDLTPAPVMLGPSPLVIPSAAKNLSDSSFRFAPFRMTRWLAAKAGLSLRGAASDVAISQPCSVSRLLTTDYSFICHLGFVICYCARATAYWILSPCRRPSFGLCLTFGLCRLTFATIPCSKPCLPSATSPNHITSRSSSAASPSPSA
jgi:hypothetical protein